MKCFINDDLLEIIDLHELCSSVSIAMLQMKTFLLGFLSFKKQTFFSSILAVFCIASLSFGMLARLSEEAIKTMFYHFKMLLVLLIRNIQYFLPPQQQRRNVCCEN